LRHSLEAARGDVPIGQFGSLQTSDRREIESFRSIKNPMGEDLDRLDPKRPLCSAVVGPPGLGKSVGVTKIAKSIAPEQKEAFRREADKQMAQHDSSDA
jgi:signal recognition particle GTPase